MKIKSKTKDSSKINPTVAVRDSISDPRTKVLLRRIYPDQAFLLNYGPLISAIVSVPKALEEKLKTEGLPIPKPIEGFLLIDTGASFTMIADDIVKALGINPTNTRTTFGIHGKNDVFVYPVTITIPVDHGQFHMSEDVAGVNLREAFEGLETALKRKVLGLLGRDFLTTVKLILDVYNGQVVLVRNDSRIKVLDENE